MLKLRYRIGFLIVALVTTYVYLTFVVTPPADHYLTADPTPATQERAKFEVAYFSYLAGITAGTIAALLALLFSEKNASPAHRTTARYGIIALLLALSIVTLGYASRNLWIATDKALTPLFGLLDYWVLGPITAVAYILGVVTLIELALLQILEDSRKS